MIYHSKIVEDSEGELCLELSDQMMKDLDLNIGDTIVWDPYDSETSTVSFRKVTRNTK